MIEGMKVVTAQEMAHVEAIAYAQGASEIAYMENAGQAVAEHVARFVEDHHLNPIITLLIGKGNNGGDAYVAGRKLLEKGFAVVAYPIYPLEECSPLCQQMARQFALQGGQVHRIKEGDLGNFNPEGVILDGLVGTGFRGAAEGILAKVITAANGSRLPILAIDIPSGVCGNTGTVATVAIQATLTIYLGLPKLGFFLGSGWDHVGELRYASFGLAQQSLDAADPSAHFVDVHSLSSLLPQVKRTRHKYEAGYVLGIAGSPGMAGAAALCSYAALKAGAGIVRLFYPQGMEGELTHMPYEIIREGWEGNTTVRIREEMSRARALFLGPGIGKGEYGTGIMEALLSHITIPCVLDADALFYLSRNPHVELPLRCVLTPHHQEMKRLLGDTKRHREEQEFLHACREYAEEKRAILVLKGAPTWIFSPSLPPCIMPAGDPGMATAGAGDVLTGVIAALLAQGLEPLRAAVLGTALHGLAGEHAAQDLTSYCLTASDLIDYLPDVFLQVMQKI